MLVGRLLTIAIVTLSLAACVDGKRLDSVLNPDPLEENVGSDAVREYRGVPDTEKSIVFKDAGSNGQNAFNVTYQARLNAAAVDTADHDTIYRYLQSGIALSDQICIEWFRRLGRAQAKVNADRDVISNVGALSAAILGMVDVSSKIVGGVAAGAGFLEDTYTSELANFVVAPDVSQVERVIELNRIELANNFAINFEANKNQFNFEVARGLLIRYDNSCSHLAVKREVNKIIAAQSTKKEKKLINPLDQLALVGIVEDIEALFMDEAKPMSIEDAFDLYVVMIGANVPAGAKAEKLKAMTEAKRLYDDAGKLRLREARLSSRLRRELLNAARFANFDTRISESNTDKKRLADEAREEQEKKKKGAAKAEAEAKKAKDVANASAETLQAAELRDGALEEEVSVKAGTLETMRSRAVAAKAELIAARTATTVPLSGQTYYMTGIPSESPARTSAAFDKARVSELVKSNEVAAAEAISEAKRLGFLEEEKRQAAENLENARNRLKVAKALAEEKAAVAANLKAEAETEPVLPSFLEILESKGGMAGRGVGVLGVIQEVE